MKKIFESFKLRKFRYSYNIEKNMYWKDIYLEIETAMIKIDRKEYLKNKKLAKCLVVYYLNKKG